MIKKFETTVKCSNTSNGIRIWGKAVSDGLQFIGIIKTSDTGQISDWNTVPSPASGNEAVGFEIFRLSDTLQGTYPIYIKIEYGCGGSTGTPSIWITIGRGTNGAGTITNILYARKQLAMLYSDASTNVPIFVVGDNSKFSLVLFQYASYSSVICLERTKGSNYIDNGDGIMMLWVNYSACECTYSKIGFEQKSYAKASLSVPYSGNGISNGEVNFYPVRAFSSAETMPFSLICGFIQNDFAYNSVIPVVCADGITRNYKTQFSNTSYQFIGYQYNPTSFALLWE